MQYLIKQLYQQNKEILGFITEFEKLKPSTDVTLEDIVTETNSLKGEFDSLG